MSRWSKEKTSTVNDYPYMYYWEGLDDYDVVPWKVFQVYHSFPGANAQWYIVHKAGSQEEAKEYIETQKKLNTMQCILHTPDGRLKNDITTIRWGGNASKYHTVMYTGIHITKNEHLKILFPPVHPNEFYDHMTMEFKGKDGYPDRTLMKAKDAVLTITGRLTTDKVDVLIVTPWYCSKVLQPKTEDLLNGHTDPFKTWQYGGEVECNNEFPHVTLSTAKGVKPFESNTELQKCEDDIQWLISNNYYIKGKACNFVLEKYRSDG